MPDNLLRGHAKWSSHCRLRCHVGGLILVHIGHALFILLLGDMLCVLRSCYEPAAVPPAMRCKISKCNPDLNHFAVHHNRGALLCQAGGVGQGRLLVRALLHAGQGGAQAVRRQRPGHCALPVLQPASRIWHRPGEAAPVPLQIVLLCVRRCGALPSITHLVWFMLVKAWHGVCAMICLPLCGRPRRDEVDLTVLRSPGYTCTFMSIMAATVPALS
jgi:hypothetical protein